ncbi:uncharacterized protein LOC129585046 isoform X2 [Paramacrobiotus metropolitanus]|uniref:uncharacterized protein LOC129585046 isoform X2 n=1 Tax=Paramacrobiotus metropolitanus TaxID=2943436 RepID=UPI002445C84A|nr:uncharacterized protein LOC129585046 isoform X2 [Paramacrobiotus metropolitanus]
MLISQRMVPTDAVIHFKFKNALETEKFPFSGASTSVRELKQFISQKHKLDQKSSRPDKSQTPSELSLENAATGEVYVSDDAEIPKDTVITVARKLAGAEAEGPEEPKQPAAAAPAEAAPVEKQVAEKPVTAPGDVPYYHSNSAYNQYQGQQDPTFEKMGFPGVITESTDISEMDEYTEEQKIFAMMYQCLLFYDHTAYVSKPRQSVYCSHCKIAGSHNTKFCPNTQDVGIIAGGRRNAQRAPTVAPTTVTTNPTAYASVPDDSYEREDIDPDLCCNICKNLLRDAVIAPCCGVNYCDACIRTTLMDEGGESVCPSCGAQLAPDACSPNGYLRSRVEKWEREMQIKRQQKKKEGSPQSVGNKINTTKEEKPVPTPKESPLTNSVSTAPPPVRTNQPGRTVNVKPEMHSAASRNAASDNHSEAKPIGSLISTTTHKIPPHIPTNVFHQQQQSQQTTAQPQNQQAMASTEARRGSFPANPQAAASLAPYLAANARMAGRQPPMNFFPGMNQFVDGAGFGYLNPAFRNPMSAAASAAFGMRGGMGNRMPYGLTPDMNRFPMFPGQQTAEMYERSLRFGNTAPSNILPSGQTLRITRIMNQKAPVQSPYDSDSPTRTDKLRDKDKDDYRRDKEEDRRRDIKPYDSKYDDRKDRRDDRKKREGSYKSDAEDRRSSERRHSREKRFRNDSRSPDRKDLRMRKDIRIKRSDDVKYDRLAEKEARRDKRNTETPKSEKTVSPPSKPRYERIEPSPVVSEPKEKDIEIVPVKSEKLPTMEEPKIPDVIKTVEKVPDEEAIRKDREEREKKEKEVREQEKRLKKEEQRRRREKREEEEKRRAQDKRERDLEQRAKQLEQLAKELERQQQEMQNMKGQMTTAATPVVVKEAVDMAELQKKAFGKWENDPEDERTGGPIRPAGEGISHGESVEESSKGYPEDRRSHKSRSKKEKKAAKASKERIEGPSGEVGEKKARRKHREGDGVERERVKRERNRQDEDGLQESRDGDERKDKAGDYRKQKTSRSRRDESMRSSREKRLRSPSMDHKEERAFKRLDSKTSEFDEGKSRERRSHRREGDEEKSRKPSRSKKDKSRSSRRADERGKVKDRDSDIPVSSYSRLDDEETEIKSASGDFSGRKLDRISGESEKKERSSEKRERHKSSKKREKSSREKRPRDGENIEERDPRKKHKKRRKRDKKDAIEVESASAEAGDLGNVSPASID